MRTALLVAAACGSMPEMGGGAVAVAELQPTKGNNTRGMVVFSPRGNRHREGNPLHFFAALAGALVGAMAEGLIFL